jgi:hypothetical protein
MWLINPIQGGQMGKRDQVNKGQVTKRSKSKERLKLQDKSH